MKNLKDILTEGILADMDDTLSVSDFDAAKIAIDTFIRENYYPDTKYRILKSPNEDGKYVVNSKGTVHLKQYAKSIVNDVFVWGSCKTFICTNNQIITSLYGSPRLCEQFECSCCSSLNSLEGGPEDVMLMKVSFSGIESLKGAPRLIRGDFDASHCDNLTSLEDGPQNCLSNYYVNHCSNLRSLKGAPKKIGYSFYCYDCPSLESLEGGPQNVLNFRCNGCNKLTSFKGAPRTIRSSFVGDCCENITSLDMSKTSIVRNFSIFGCKNLKSFEGGPKSIGDSYDAQQCRSVTSMVGLPKIILGYLHLGHCTNLSSAEGCPKEVGKSLSIQGTHLHKEDVIHICNAKHGIVSDK